MPIPENLLIELRAELSDVRSLLIEALGDFKMFQEGVLVLHEREQRVTRFYRIAFIALAAFLAVVVGVGGAQLVSGTRIARQTKAIAVNTQQSSDGNRKLLEEVDCVVRVLVEVLPKDQPTAYSKCLQPRK